MSSTTDNDDCCCPGFKDSQYNRGPSDKNPAMFDFERKMADAIEARCGRATDPQSGMPSDGKVDGRPGQ